MAVTYRVARIMKISSTNHTSAELACIPSASGENLGQESQHDRKAFWALLGSESFFSDYCYLIAETNDNTRAVILSVLYFKE